MTSASPSAVPSAIPPMATFPRVDVAGDGSPSRDQFAGLSPRMMSLAMGFCSILAALVDLVN